MPNRILREGILTSPRMARLDWAAEVFYRRLMSVVDDFGRYYADVGMLRAACFPRQLSKVSDSDVGKWLQGIAAAGLVRVYPAKDGERYLELLDFGQQVRAKKSKFPDEHVTCAADAKQVNSDGEADAPVFGDVVVDEDEGEKKPRKRAAPTGIDRPDDVDPDVWADWTALRAKKRTTVSATVVTEARKEAGKAGMTLEMFFRVWCLRGSQGLQADWLTKDERSAVHQTAASREANSRVAAAVPSLAARPAPAQQTAEVFDVTARRLG